VKPNFSPKYLFVTLLGSGYLPKAPGSWGSLLAVLPAFFDIPYIRYIFLLLFLLSWLSVPLINSIEKETHNDPGFIVIDEAMGIWFIFISPYIPHKIIYIFFGFLLFRIFDILKPYPCSVLNRQKGGVYVMLDDLFAAIYASIVLHLLIMAENIFGFFNLIKLI
jgi:phosphatidylglycerophosphatase A